MSRALGTVRAGRRRIAEASPAAIGLAVIVAAALLFYLAFAGLPGGPNHELTLAFRSADGVMESTPVRIAGVDVGQVTKVEPGPGGTAFVTADIEDHGLPVHEDARAKLRPRTFLEGNFFIDLEPGSPGAPELGDGGEIPITRTATPVQFYEILRTLKDDVRESLRGGIRSLGRALAGGAPEALNETIPLLGPALGDTSLTAEALRGGRRHDLSGAIRATARLSTALAGQRPALESLVSDFARVAAALADRDAELSRSVALLPRVLEEAEPSLGAIDAAVPETRALIAELRPALRATPATVDLTLPFLRQANRLLSRRELPALVDRLRPAARDLARFAPDGVELFDRLRPAVGCLEQNVIPTLKGEVEDPPHTTGEPAYRELLYLLVGLSSGSQNFDGNGFNLRYHAGFSDELIATEAPTPSETLFGFSAAPPTGSRPAAPEAPPPFEPDEPCIESDPPDLSAATGPGGFSAVAGGSR